VHGDHERYRVIVSEEGIHCDCPARVALCSHAIAVASVQMRDHASIHELFYGPHVDVDRPSDEDGLEPREPIAPWAAS